MELPTFVSSIMQFLRAGYPEGVPTQDYIPLLALLTRELNPAEVLQVADQLAASGDASSAESIRQAISTFTNEPPHDADIARVAAHLAAGGWPLASPYQSVPHSA
jgi:Protein of unknown function (DUF3349)